eukprot:1204051-Rhodomonas_salina.1
MRCSVLTSALAVYSIPGARHFLRDVRVYQVAFPWLQNKRIEDARSRLLTAYYLLLPTTTATYYYYYYACGTRSMVLTQRMVVPGFGSSKRGQAAMLVGVS